jgi:translation elongation factor EF-Tu-like GTPase
MKSYLSTVDEVFEITDRGLVVSPGIPRDCELIVRIGDRLELVRPDDSVFTTDVVGIEHVSRSQGTITSNALQLPLGLHKEDAPPGTKLFVIPREQ